MQDEKAASQCWHQKFVMPIFLRGSEITYKPPVLSYFELGPNFELDRSSPCLITQKGKH